MGVTNRDAVRAFLAGSVSVRASSGTIFSDGDVLYSYGKHWILAIRHGRYVFINNDYYSATTAKHRSHVINETPSYMRIHVSMSALERAVMDGFLRRKSTGNWTMDLMMEETVLLDVSEGEALINWGEDYYLIGHDDTLKDGFNTSFVALLSKPSMTKRGVPHTVEEAYNTMVPFEVTDKGDVKRQGEWFFYPMNISTPAFTQENRALVSMGELEDLDEEDSRHVASEWFRDDDGQYVRGIIKHPEHRQLKLYDPPKPKKLQWYAAVEAMRENSWSGSAGGGVD